MRQDSTSTTTPVPLRVQLTAGLLGVGFVGAVWIVVLVSMWSGLVLGLPQSSGGFGLSTPGTTIGIITIGTVASALVLAAIYAILRGVGTRHPLIITLVGAVLTLILCGAFIMLIGQTFLGRSTTLGVWALLLIGFLTFAALGRWLPAPPATTFDPDTDYDDENPEYDDESGQPETNYPEAGYPETGYAAAGHIVTDSDPDYEGSDSDADDDTRSETDGETTASGSDGREPVGDSTSEAERGTANSGSGDGS